MNLQRFNKWTQYLRRNVLLEMCEMFRAYINTDGRTAAYLSIIGNPGYNAADFAAVFTNTEWPPAPNSAPLPFTDEEFAAEREGRSIINMMNEFPGRITESIYQKYRPPDEHEFVARLRPRSFAQIARNPYLHINTVVRFIPCAAVVPHHKSTILAIAMRPDLTAEAARMICEWTKENAILGAYHLTPDIREAIARNPWLGVDAAYEIVGVNTALMANYSLTKQHLQDSRFAALASTKEGRIALSMNCNFRIVRNFSAPTHPIMFTNPRLMPRNMVLGDFCPAIFKNKYTHDPWWRAECQRREAARNEWLATAWNELAARMLPEIATLVLEIWYSEVA